MSTIKQELCADSSMFWTENSIHNAKKNLGQNGAHSHLQIVRLYKLCF
jgi:hypothetical protein